MTSLRFASSILLGWSFVAVVVVMATEAFVMPTAAAFVFVGSSRSRVFPGQASSSYHYFSTSRHQRNNYQMNSRASRALPATLAKRSGPPTDDEDDDVVSILLSTNVVDPRSGRRTKALDTSPTSSFLMASTNFFQNSPFAAVINNNNNPTKKVLLVVMPQLGDFDSAEYAEQLCALLPDLKKANVDLRIVGIGNMESAKLFSRHTGMPLDHLLVDPTATVHQRLGLHRGPNWDVPSWIPNSVLDWFASDICQNKNPNLPSIVVARAWLNYMAMCAGIAAPGTLAEILRGYLGDRSAPERLRPGERIEAGPIAITGVTDVKLGPIEYQSLWKDQEGFLRPAELATLRLRSMVEVLSKFDQYVPNQTLLDWRGATFLLDANDNYNTLYEYRNRGVLTYSETMDRPLSFLSPYVGQDRSRNPFGMKDPSQQPATV